LICVIPARGGSQRIPLKNIKPFHGKPIIAYSIELGRQTCTRTIVSTDSEEIAAVAREYGAEVHERPSELARDEIGTQEVVGAVIKDLGIQSHVDVCALYATSPLLTEDEFMDAGMSFQLNDECSCVYSIDIEGEPSGGFYFAPAEFFTWELDPYESGFGWLTRDIDINTPDDWNRAEKLYEEMHHGN